MTGWEQAFGGPDGSERLYRFNLLRDTIFAPKTAQVWWMSEAFRDTFMRWAPDTWSFMRLRLMVAEHDEYLELPPTLAQLVRTALRLDPHAPISAASARTLRTLHASYSQLDSKGLEGLRHFAGLEVLYLRHNHISEIGPLGDLTNLHTLSLKDNPISDVTPLGNLTALQRLGLGTTRVSDLAPVARLVNLEGLDLSNTLVSDISSLSRLSNLLALDLSGSHVIDLAVLESLTKLQVLYISKSQISGYAHLLKLPMLKRVVRPDLTEWNPQEGPPPSAWLSQPPRTSRKLRRSR